MYTILVLICQAPISFLSLYIIVHVRLRSCYNTCVTAKDIIDKYIAFFEEKGHKRIPSAPLVPPENDRTTLFITAGMQPLVPYLLGKPHPLGKKLVDVQKCLRTDDIAEVGDATHHTFYEMLGNWSLGDYWKEDAITWSFEFLTKELNIPLEKLAVTVFAGDKDVPKDEDSFQIWRKVGMPKDRIFLGTKKDNWWGPVGKTGPCGPDTEMFIWTGKNKPHGEPNKNPNWVEIWNDVFMEFNKKEDGTYEHLKQRNVDTGMGLERITTVLEGKQNNYQTDLFLPLYEELKKSINQEINETRERRIRVFLDHSRASIFLINDGILPGKNERESVLRRLIRTANDQLTILLSDKKHTNTFNWWRKAFEHFKQVYSGRYEFTNNIVDVIENELKLYGETIAKGTPRVEKLLEAEDKYPIYIQSQLDKFRIDIPLESFLTLHSLSSLATVAAGTIAFEEKSSQGFPFDQSFNLAQQKLGSEFKEEQARKTIQLWQQEHQKVSRASIEKKFRGGLADHEKKTIMGHTATHLLHQALRDILGNKVHQTGSNITTERVRFDFNYDKKLTDEEIKKVEDIINKKIKENLLVYYKLLPKEEAYKLGAIGLFEESYGDKVKIYFIGGSAGSLQDGSENEPQKAYSIEFCGGPHVNFTGELKSVKIERQENLGKNQRRIYMTVEG